MVSEKKQKSEFSIVEKDIDVSYQESQSSYNLAKLGKIDNVWYGMSPLTGKQEPLNIVRRHYAAKMQLKAGTVVGLMTLAFAFFVLTVFGSVLHTIDIWFGYLVVAGYSLGVFYLKWRVDSIKKSHVRSYKPKQPEGRFYTSPLTGRYVPKRRAIKQYSCIQSYHFSFAANCLYTALSLYVAITRSGDVSDVVAIGVFLGVVWLGSLLSKWRVDALNKDALEYLSLEENPETTHMNDEAMPQTGLTPEEDDSMRFYSPFTGLEVSQKTFKLHTRENFGSVIASVVSAILIYSGSFVAVGTVHMLDGVLSILGGLGLIFYMDRRTNRFEKKAVQEANNFEMTDMV